MRGAILSGIFLIALIAFSSGSFAVPFGKIKDWKWETYWMIFSFGAYILFLFVACLVLAPDFVLIIRNTPFTIVLTVFLLGGVYGVGIPSFGLVLLFFGLSLGYALSLGLILAIGTLIPSLIDGRLRIMWSMLVHFNS